jgi:glycosyltransferase involved in cell wall biosynthesis
MRRMILHIGNPKAGSSSLQKFFFDHRDALSERGILYPVTDNHPVMAHYNLAFSISPLKRMRQLYTPDLLTFDKLAAMLETRDEDVVLISAESFVALSDKPAVVNKIKQFAKSQNLLIDVVVLIRPQHLFFESVYSQSTKALLNNSHFRQFVLQNTDERVPANVKYLKIWDAPPLTRLIPLPFTAARLKPDLETVFFEATGLADRVRDFLQAAPREIVNRRPGPLTVELCRRASDLESGGTVLRDQPMKSRRLHPIMDYLQNYTDKRYWNETPFNGLDDELADRIRRKFARQNAAFARRYWDEPWMDIFATDYAREFVPNELGQREITPEEELAIETALRKTARKFGLTHKRRWSKPRFATAKLRHRLASDTRNADRDLAAKTNILILSHRHPQLSKGGAETASYALFRALGKSARFTPYYAASEPRDTSLPRVKRFDGRPREFLWRTPPLRTPYLTTRSKKRLAADIDRLLAETGAGIVHFHHILGFGIDALKLFKQKGVTVFLTLHEYLAICQNDGQMVKARSHDLCHEASLAGCRTCFPKRSMLKIHLRRRRMARHLAYVDRFIAPSRFLRDRFVAWGLPAEKICHIGNLTGIEPAGRRKRAITNDIHNPVRFGFFGQVTPYKGIDIFLRALDQIDPAVRNKLTLSIHAPSLKVGLPAYQDELAGLMERHKDVAAFKGAYDNNKVVGLMRQVDWVVVPSIWWENAPLVIQEARAAGVPVLCADIGGMKEHVVNGETGLHFQAGRPDSLARRLAQIVSGEHAITPSPINMRALNAGILDAHLRLYDQL